jgi:hypothetical protein
MTDRAFSIDLFLFLFSIFLIFLIFLNFFTKVLQRQVADSCFTPASFGRQAQLQGMMAAHTLHTLQHTATHCNTLQHTAQHTNTPSLFPIPCTHDTHDTHDTHHHR